MITLPQDFFTNANINRAPSDSDSEWEDATDILATPEPQDDIFLDERKQLQTQARALFDEAAVLRRRLTALTDRQMVLNTCGLPPAFDANDELLGWLQALPASVLRNTLPTSGTVLEQAVARAGGKFGPQVVSLGAGMCDVLMRLRTADFSDRQMRALGLRPGGTLTLTVHFEPGYHKSPEPPALTIEYSVPNTAPQVATSAVTGAKHQFRLGYQMLNILTKHLSDAWRAGATENVLVEVLTLAAKRMQDLPQHCVVCDGHLKTTQLRPTTCGGKECIGQAETWGYGFEPQDIAQNPEVTDLLLSLTYAAATAGREAFFTRVPAVFRLKGKTDFKALTDEMDRFPSLDRLVNSSDMISTLEAVSPTAVTTMSWLMVSNEGYLEYIPPHQQCAAMNTPFQFRIFGGPVEREIAFQARPGQEKNRFAFHGSAFANWHSILRTGLVVGGSTRGYDYNGAAHGKGIYVSNDAATSMGYSRTGIKGWYRSRFGQAPACLALCETNGASRRSSVGRALGSIEVFPEASAVALRYLFVYTDNLTPPTANATEAARVLRSRADKDNSAFIKRVSAGWRPW